MDKYQLVFTSKFKKDFKKIRTKPKELKKTTEVFDLLMNGGVDLIPQTMKPHKLIGNYKGYWECHVLPDLLLIWEQEDGLKEIILIRVGSHSDLFK